MKDKSKFSQDSTLTEDAIIRSLVKAEVLIVDNLEAELGALDANAKVKTSLIGCYSMFSIVGKVNYLQDKPHRKAFR